MPVLNSRNGARLQGSNMGSEKAVLMASCQWSVKKQGTGQGLLVTVSTAFVTFLQFIGFGFYASAQGVFGFRLV